MKVDEIEIPDWWCAKLAELKRASSFAVIAGGAIRDLYFGREVKDVDYFITGALPAWEADQRDPIDYKGMNYVMGVASYKGPLPINVVVVEPIDTMKLISSFDFGICQIAFDGEALIKSPAFLWDAKYNLITMRHVDRYARSIRRYCRINQRYNLDIVIPELDKKHDITF